jgi:hypothetical protein
MSVVAMLAVAATTLSPIHLTVRPNDVTGTISPYIYGMNQPDWGKRTKSLTLYRWGGNRTTAYNWENNASNAGTDWFNQNDDYLGGGETPGLAVRKWTQKAADIGAASLVTIPIIGHVAADKDGGGDVDETPDYLNVRFNAAFAKKPTALRATPNLNDHAVYMDEFAYHLIQRHATKGKSLFFALDNEPDLWAETHPRITETHPTYTSLLSTSKEYAAALKDVAPDSLVFGPASYGWWGYQTLQDAPDANGRFFLDYYLRQMKAAEVAGGRRLLDVLDLHWYPEAMGGGQRITNDSNDPEVYNARIQAPRSLWDPSYTEDSWIAEWMTFGPIRLIGLMQDKIAANYPGTNLAFTEWNYGGGNHITGGMAVADVLGVYGKYGVFAATYWNLGSNESFAYGGFDAYRNFDGAGGKFGDRELGTVNPAVDTLSIYASKQSGAAKTLTFVVVNKASSNQKAFIDLDTGSVATVSAYRMKGLNSHMVPVAAPAITAEGISQTLPAWSVTTYRLQLN